MDPNTKPVVLTIAGLDPSGGAGVIADVKTFVAFGCFPTAALTSITFQNTTGVFGAIHQSAATLRSQLDPVIDDFAVAAVKTGMLPTAEIVAAVAQFFREAKCPAPVVDPVMVSTSGHDLIGDDAFRILKADLLPLARIVTPNIPEAERLVSFSITTEQDMRRAAESIRELGVRAVLLKGGHLGRRRQEQAAGAGEAVDILLDDAGNFTEFREEFIDVGEVHGSGCTLSAAIAACLAKGMELDESVRESKQYVTDSIRSLVSRARLGHGARPL